MFAKRRPAGGEVKDLPVAAARRAASAEPKFFATPAEFRRWLSRHAATAKELLVGFHKVGTGKPSMTWPKSVDEALCVGWIDGVRRRLDEEAYTIRFTPRRKGSVWSKVNIARAEALIAEGRMKPAGLAEYEKRFHQAKSGYSYEKMPDVELSAAELKALKTDKAAWNFHEKVAPSYRKACARWIASAKQPATRERRFGKYLAACAAGKRLMA
jgi:uncharacterized protein YdeI (YjbR/CyaY-like superfamily)